MKQASIPHSEPWRLSATAMAASGNLQLQTGKRHDFVKRLWLALVMLLQLAATGPAFTAERPMIREVLVSREGHGARIEIRADQALTYRSYLMPGLEKWVIDLPGAKTTYRDDESKKMRTPPLERITVRKIEVNGDQLTRIGLDFRGEVDFSLLEDQLDRGHLIVIMKPLKSSQQRAAEASAPTASKAHSDLSHK